MTSQWVCLLPAPFGTRGPTNSFNQKPRGRQKTWLSFLFSKNVSAARLLVWHHKANIAACTFHLAQTANAHLLQVTVTICGPLDVTHVCKGLWFSPTVSELSLSDRLERQPVKTHRKRAVEKVCMVLSVRKDYLLPHVSERRTAAAGYVLNAHSCDPLLVRVEHFSACTAMTIEFKPWCSR